MLPIINLTNYVLGWYSNYYLYYTIHFYTYQAPNQIEWMVFLVIKNVVLRIIVLKNGFTVIRNKLNIGTWK